MKQRTKNKITKLCALGLSLSVIVAPLTAKAYVEHVYFKGDTIDCTGTVAGTLGKNKTSSCVGSTLYDAEHINLVGIFGYDSNGSLLTSASAERAVLQARATTKTKKGVTKYKLSHNIITSARVPVKSVKYTIS